MTLTRPLLLSCLVGVALASPASGQSAGAGPLVLGQFAVTRLYAGQEAEIVRERSGWKVERIDGQISLANTDYDRTYSVDSPKFANRIVLVRKRNDFTERYVLHASAPNEHSRIVYKVERTIDYPNRLARPPVAEFLQAMADRWGATSYAMQPAAPKPGETQTYVWYFRRDGSPVDPNQGCDETMGNGRYVGGYSLENRPQVEKAETAMCNAYVTASVKVDEANYVEHAGFDAYSNFALMKAMEEDEAMLHKRLEAFLDQNVRERRRVLAIPQM